MAIKLTQNSITFNNIDRPATNGNSKYNYGNYKDKNTGQDATRSTTEISDPVNNK